MSRSLPINTAAAVEVARVRVCVHFDETRLSQIPADGLISLEFPKTLPLRKAADMCVPLVPRLLLFFVSGKTFDVSMTGACACIPGVPKLAHRAARHLPGSQLDAHLIGTCHPGRPLLMVPARHRRPPLVSRQEPHSAASRARGAYRPPSYKTFRLKFRHVSLGFICTRGASVDRVASIECGAY